MNPVAAQFREESLRLSAAGDAEAAAEAALQALEAAPDMPEVRRWAAVLVRHSREPLPPAAPHHRDRHQRRRDRACPGARRRSRRHQDPWFRAYDAWIALERRDPLLFIGTYEF